MNTYRITYRNARGLVSVTRVKATSVHNAVFRFLETRDLPVLSASRADSLLCDSKTGKTMNEEVKKIYAEINRLAELYDKQEREAKSESAKAYNRGAYNVLYNLRYFLATMGLKEAATDLAGGAPHPKH